MQLKYALQLGYFRNCPSPIKSPEIVVEKEAGTPWKPR